MTLKTHIEIAVNDSFKTIYERNLVKTYLFYWLLFNKCTNRPFHKYEVGQLVGIDTAKVTEYLIHMQREGDRRRNPFLPKDFEQKFTAVEKACIGYAESLRMAEYNKSLKVSSRHLETARKRNFEHYLN